MAARKKLKEWRESRGISYKRPPMQVKAQVKPPSGKDEVDSLISTLDRALSDCVKLLEEVGFLVESRLRSLDALQTRRGPTF